MAQEKNIRVLVVYPYMPHYRYGVFTALDQLPGFDFAFASDVEGIDGIPALPASAVRRHTTLPSRRVGRATWQRGLIGLVLKNRYDVVILAGDASHLSTWIAAAILRVLHRRVMFWTIGWTRPEAGLKRFVRLAFYHLANRLLLYGNVGFELGAAHGYPAERMSIIRNSQVAPPRALRERDAGPANQAARLNLASESPVVGAIIRLIPVKRLDLLISAARVLKNRGTPITVVLAGDGPGREALEKQAAAFEVDLRLLGAIYDPELIEELYARFDLTVVPAAVGLTAIQSLRHGVPVVSDDDAYSQMPEWDAIIEGKTGGHFRKHDAESLADSIQQWLYRVEKGRATVAINCRSEVAANWTPEVQVELIEQAIAIDRSVANGEEAPRRMRQVVMSPYFLLSLSLTLIAIGNLVFLETVMELKVFDYLYLAFATVCLYIVFNFRSYFRRLNFKLGLLLFAVSVLPAFFYAPLTSYGVSILMSFAITGVALTAPAVFSDSEDGLKTISKLLMAISLTYAVLLLLFGSLTSSWRFSFLGMNPVGMARATTIFALIALTLLLTRWLEFSWSRRVFLIAGTLLSVFACFQTGSRGPLLSLVVAIAVLLFVLVAQRRIKWRTLLRFAVVSAGATVILGAVAIAFTQLVGGYGFSRILMSPDSGRGDLYSDVWGVIFQHPFGIGWGNLALYLPQWSDEGFPLYAHNVFLELMVSAGPMAVLMFVILIVVALSSVYKAFNAHAKWAPVALTLLVFALASAMISSDIVGNRLMWLSIGLALAVRSTRQKNSISQNTTFSEPK